MSVMTRTSILKLQIFYIKNNYSLSAKCITLKEKHEEFIIRKDINNVSYIYTY